LDQTDGPVQGSSPFPDRTGGQVLGSTNSSKNRTKPDFSITSPEYQALIMVDNSQGHGIYAPNALLTQDMNFNPAGSQPRL